MKGLTLKQALKIGPEEITEYLGGLPKHKFHCSILGHEALEVAIKAYRVKQNQPKKSKAKAKKAKAKAKAQATNDAKPNSEAKDQPADTVPESC